MNSFTRKVYEIVLKIPLGKVRTYSWVAKKAGRPKASRAVGNILRNNPYPILIPCHRVIKSNGEIGGYSKGIRKKKALLLKEKEIIRWLKSRP
ncbi:MAG: MGMT family protein [Candidatus Omnitrophica bacterium]|nr:MGMT family protein [Candidatus Omnitrophota bacterium]